MNFQSELSGLLEERISRYYQDLNVEEVGTVLSIGDGIVRVYGLQNIQAGKMVEFSSGVKGLRVASRNVFNRPTFMSRRFERNVYFQISPTSEVTVDIPYGYTNDNRVVFYITDWLLYNLLKVKGGDSVMIKFGGFQKKYGRFVKRQPESLVLFSATLIYENAKVKKSRQVLASPGIWNFIKDFPEYEVHWANFDYLLNQIRLYIQNRENTMNGLSQDSFSMLTVVDANRERIIGEVQGNELVEAILNNDNVCYILRFTPTSFYIGSTLSSLLDRLNVHKKTKGKFEVYKLFRVNPGLQISSRVVESALHVVCSELLGVSVNTIEALDASSEKGYTVQFKTEQGINIALDTLYLSLAYDFRGRMESVEEGVLQGVSARYDK